MIIIKWFVAVIILMLFSFNALAAGGGGGGGGAVTGSTVPSMNLSLQIAMIIFVAYLYRKRK
ncbi:hypothetical protein L3081_04010 [Colwellia sp. MSW7]|jgi:hypothetical protein|uniref:GlyGly-CTERM sorting domain-containing protein n=1 Tax=Colwellia maritima TaxID=2912588 RepID=A0ABS9WXN5_9GAMM|nr:hypothetical protein [Colwellia maritima]MCI2282724.1 hypothetical protein [Colwellia maritima]